MNALRWAIQSARRRGVSRTVQIAGNVVSDVLFDWRYGTDTIRWVDAKTIESRLTYMTDPGFYRAGYKATKARPFVRLLQQLVLPRQSAFVDIGSGKGRVLLMVSQLGFRRVVGVEQSPSLCAIARSNIEQFAKRVGPTSPIEIVQADATEYRFRPDDSVLFMFNPFGAAIMEKVMGNVRDSLQQHPRTLHLIYNTPKHHDVIVSSGLFGEGRQVELGGNEFRVYTNGDTRS